MTTLLRLARTACTGLALCGLSLGARIPAAEIVLPIEVLGASVPVIRTVTVATAAPAATLALRVHGLAHANLAEVRLDDRPWIPINDDTATVLGLAQRYGGIGGSFATLDLRVPLTPALPSGAHTLAFRFAQGDGITIGFRVLRLDLLDAAGGSTLVGTTFRNDDPATWTAPRPGASERAAGEALWRTAELRDGIGRPVIRARCGDCHAQDGHDLAYFNYSNHAIIERSTFHGLSQTQGEQIASYIRALPGSVNGRPWNPPYQPGPGLSARPVAEWAAGAGIDAIPRFDADALAHVPGANGDAREIIDEDGRVRDLPIHDLPIAFQLLDWNHWLPRVHPLDAPGFDFTTSAAKAEYERLRTKLSGPDGAAFFDGGFNGGRGENTTFNKLRDEMGNLKILVAPGVDRSLDRVVTPADANRIYSANLWAGVKLWEMMQEFGLEGRGKISYGAIGPEREWYSNRYIFDLSPFLSGLSLAPTVPLFGDGPGPLNTEYIDNAWYELQMLLNAGKGSRSSGGHGVIDWSYMGNFFGVSATIGEGEPGRRTIFTLMSLQQRNPGIALNHDHSKTTSFPETDGWDYSGTATALHDYSPDYWRLVADPRPMIQAVLQADVELEARFTHEEWRAAAGEDDEGLPNWDYVIGTAHNPDINYAEFYVEALLHARDQHRVAEPVVNGMAAVGKLKWPNNDWNAHRKATATIAAPAACTATSGVGSIRIAWSAVPGATSYNLYRSNHPSDWFVPIQLLTTGTTATDRRLAPGSTWYYYVTANVGGTEGAGRSPIASGGVARGMVARWAFDESGTAVFDASGLRNHGELVGPVQRIPGRHGGALRIAAQDQFASVRYDASRSLLSGATVTAWVRSSAAVGQYRSMTVLGGTYWFGTVYQDGKPRVRIADDGEVAGATSILDGQWHHLAMSHAADSEVRIWVDGVLSGSGRIPVRVNGARLHDLGRGTRRNGEDTTWIGDLDDIRIYDQVLGAAEIRAIMDDDSAGPATDPDGDFHAGTPDPNPPGGGSGGGSIGGTPPGGAGGGKGCGVGSGFTLLAGLLGLGLGLGRRRRAA